MHLRQALSPLTRIFHHPPATTTKLLVPSGRAPSAVLSGLKARLRASPVRSPRIHGQFDALAAKSGEKSGLSPQNLAYPILRRRFSIITARGLILGAALALFLVACGDDGTDSGSTLCTGPSCSPAQLDPLGGIGGDPSDTDTTSTNDAFATKDTSNTSGDATNDTLDPADTTDTSITPDVTDIPDTQTLVDTVEGPDTSTTDTTDTQSTDDTGTIDPEDVSPSDASPDTTADTISPPENITSCFGIINCTSQCNVGDALCHTACHLAATDDAKAALAAFESCSVDHCSNLAGEQQVGCMLENCLNETAACWTGGTADCATTYACAGACGINGPSDCGEQCIAQASEAGFKHFVDYMLCTQSKCNAPGGFCGVYGAVTCHEEAVACGVYKGTGQCSDAIGCLTTCMSNTCMINCQTKLSVDEAKTLADLIDCVFVVCGPNPAPGCFESAATQQCQSFAIACYL